MKITNVFFSALVFAAVNVNAAELQTQTPPNSFGLSANFQLAVDCRAERLPSLRAVGEFLGSNNGTKIYSERERFIHAAHRECRRGAARVVFVRDTAAAVPVRAIAAAKGEGGNQASN